MVVVVVVEDHTANRAPHHSGLEDHVPPRAGFWLTAYMQLCLVESVSDFIVGLDDECVDKQ